MPRVCLIENVKSKMSDLERRPTRTIREVLLSREKFYEGSIFCINFSTKLVVPVLVARTQERSTGYLHDVGF